MVVHLELDGRHYYYGNLKAMCDSWSKETLGVSYNYLRNFGLNSSNPFMGEKCIVRRGAIITSRRNIKTNS